MEQIKRRIVEIRCDIANFGLANGMKKCFDKGEENDTGGVIKTKTFVRYISIEIGDGGRGGGNVLFVHTHTQTRISQCELEFFFRAAKVGFTHVSAC